jgi:isopentenyl-diphosphate delta-isomerase
MHEEREEVILVNPFDEAIGFLDKIKAHKTGVLHRAVSVFVFHSDGRLLLQRRAAGKYHSGGLWSNTCCTHPRPGESVHAAARRRLLEEMGMKMKLSEVHSFIYRTELSNGLIEHEFDHVFIGTTEATPVPNASEVAEWKWIWPQELLEDMQNHPANYTYWLGICIREVLRSGKV